jgi:hypothetical protein
VAIEALGNLRLYAGGDEGDAMSDDANKPVWDRKAGARNKSTALWLVLGIIAVIVISIFGASQMAKTFGEIAATAPSDAVSRGPRLLGAAFGIVLAGSLIWAGIVWAIIYFAFVRSRAPSRGPGYFAAMAVVAFLVNGVIMLGISGHANRDQNKIAVREITGDMRNIDALAHGKQTLDTRVKAQGEAGVMEGVIKSTLARVLADRQAYRQELEAIGFKAVLSPPRLAQDPGLQRTRAILEKAHGIISKYRKINAGRIDEMRAAVVNSNMTPDGKASFLKGMASSEQQSRAELERVWTLEDDIVSKMQGAVGVLARAQGRWVVRGNKLLFVRPNEMVAYQNAIAAVRAGAEEEKSLQQESVDRSVKAADQMDAQVN